ncbi:hypothetical protein [Massilia endophytica]|nr:hypothetical protein [Massilia endophytica]
MMKRRLLRAAGWLAAIVVLALAFLAYLRPDFMFDLGNRIAMCM